MGNRAVTCEEVIRVLAVDGDAATNRTEIEAHLEVCPSCRAAERDYRETWSLLDRHRVVSPSRDFTPTLLAKIRRTEPARTRRWTIRVAMTSFAAAAALLAAVLLPLTMIEQEQGGTNDFAVSQETGLSPEDEEVVANLDLIEHLELAQLLDVVEDESALNNLMMLEKIAPRDDGR